MTVAKAQQDPILRAFDLRRFKISTKAGQLSIVAPKSMESLVAKMTELDDRARNERMPFWAELWPSSVAAARLLARGPSLAGRRVLDLGCGVGVAGSAAAACGADVLFLDLFEEAAAFALFNGREAAAASARIEARAFDWKAQRIDEGFDLVVCSDCVYEEQYHEHVLANIRIALEKGGEGAEAWVLDPMRAVADVFFDAAAGEFETAVDEVETHWPDRSVELRRLTIRAR